VISSTDTLLAIFEPLPQWLNFLAMSVAILLAATGAFIWFRIFGKKGKRKRRHHSREKRQLNPTLAETGGLPPVRGNEKSSAQTPPT
jgi:hypothetical protein